MPSLAQIGNRKPAEKTITLKPVEDSDFELTLSYRPGKITLANYVDEDRASDDPNALAIDLCDRLIASWDLDGPVLHAYTGEELVADGERIPLDPDVVQHIDPDVLLRINQLIHEDAIPNLKRSLRRSQKR